MSAPALLNCSWTTITNRLAWHLYGLRPDGSGNVFGGVASANQQIDILNCVQDGLAYVYNAWRWSFFRPRVTFNTYPTYATGTVTIDVNGNVTLSGGTFPSYSASAGGQFYLRAGLPPNFFGGTWTVVTYTSGTSIALTNYTGPAFATTLSSGVNASVTSIPVTSTAITPLVANTTLLTIDSEQVLYTGTAGGNLTVVRGANGTVAASHLINAVIGSYYPYQIYFNTYPMPSGFDSFEGGLTFPPSASLLERHLDKVDEYQIRYLTQRDNVPAPPRKYARVTNTFDPTAGSAWSVQLWPVPDNEYTLTGIATVRPTMIDATNLYPIGAEILANVLMESCLAAAERNVQLLDARSPDAVHNQILDKVLTAAIAQDRDHASPDTVGVDHGREHGGGRHRHHDCWETPGTILWEGSVNAGGPSGYI